MRHDDGTIPALAFAASLVGLSIPFIYCLLFGALISPTDPIAVLGELADPGDFDLPRIETLRRALRMARRAGRIPPLPPRTRPARSA